ncbi:hypothetical protein E2562_031997, partial [Oryza meyeriana var. granulata]
PPGFVVDGEEHKVLCLEKVLYGLRQALRAWYAKLNASLLALGFHHSALEHAVRVARPILGIGVRTIALLDVQLQEDIRDLRGIKGGFPVDRVYNPAAEELGIKHGNLEDYLLTHGWDYLKDKSICMKDVKLRVFDLKSGVERDVTLPVRFYDKAESGSKYSRTHMYKAIKKYF